MNTQHELIERVACYIRVSHQEQKLRGLSPDAQRDKLTAFAVAHNLKIVEWYEDLGVSGRKLIKNRPALQQMIKDAETGKFDRIIFIKLDRYFRSVGEYYEYQKRLDAKNVKWTATEEKFDLTTASGRYWVTTKLAIAEFEADQTGERISLINEYKVKTGQPLVGSQSLGYAFCVEKDEEGVKRVVQDPNTKDIVIDFINHFLLHHNKRQAYIYAKNKHNSDVSYNSLANLLKDTKLYGYYRGNPNYCKGYIDKETFDKIQELSNYNIKINKTNTIYLFTGLIKCYQCGNVLVGKHITKIKTTKPSGKIYCYNRDYHYYKCNGHYINDICNNSRSINESYIENWLLNYFDKFVNNYIEDVEIEDKTKKDNSVKDKIKQLKSELTRLNTMYQKNRISEEKYDKEYESLELYLMELEKQLDPVIERDLTIYEELLKSDWKTLYNALTKENKRSFWRKYIKQILINENLEVENIIFF